LEGKKNQEGAKLYISLEKQDVIASLNLLMTAGIEQEKL